MDADSPSSPLLPAACPPDATPSAEAVELRRRAERRLAGLPAGEEGGAADARKLVHELRVHQIELEMQNEALRVHQTELEAQNEALRAAQAELQADLERFVALGELGPVGYLSVTDDGTIAQLNLPAAGLLGLGCACPGGRRLGAFLAAASVPVFNDFVEGLFASAGRQVCELVVEPSGEGEPVVVQVEGVRDRSRPICHLAAINVTERRRAEEALAAAKAEAERANLAKSRFLAAASHDLRQPLAALALYVDVLDKRLPAERGVPVQSMRDCVASLSELLGDLLDLSKLDAGVVTPQPQDFALDQMIDRTLSAHLPEARRKGLPLRHAASAIAVRTDPVLLARIVGNFVANAVRYTERGGVLVGVRRRHGRRWLEVWDTGIGFSEASRGEIFDEFRQLGNPQRNRAQGSGLGLAIAARTAALLGLEIRVRSRPGKGSMFAVELPAGRKSPPVSGAVRASGSARIGLVEDEPAVREALAFALRELGHEVTTAAASGELVAALGARAPGLVISDYRLGPHEDGLDVVRALREAFGEGLPAIVLTGDTDPQVIRRIAAAGIALEHKPLTLDALQRRILALMHPG